MFSERGPVEVGALNASGLGKLRIQAPFFDFLPSNSPIFWMNQDCAKCIMVVTVSPSFAEDWHDWILMSSHWVLFSSLILPWAVQKFMG